MFDFYINVVVVLCLVVVLCNVVVVWLLNVVVAIFIITIITPAADNQHEVRCWTRKAFLGVLSRSVVNNRRDALDRITQCFQQGGKECIDFQAKATATFLKNLVFRGFQIHDSCRTSASMLAQVFKGNFGQVRLLQSLEFVQRW